VGQLGDSRGSSGDSSAGGAASGTGGGSGTGGPPKIPFDPLPVSAYVTKVKTLLTGLAPTQAEIDAVTANPKSLGDLVDAWMKLPAYHAKMELFFGDAFQQSQARQTDFKTVIDDGEFTPNDGLLLNFRQSFARTMTALVAEGQPFTAAATTTRYMMTTALMTYYAYADTSLATDATATDGGTHHSRFYQADHNWSWTLTSKRVIPLADSGNPASPDYLVFSVPNLSTLYGNTPTAAHCSTVDPIVFDNSRSFALGDNSIVWLYSFLKGENFWFFDPPQDQPNANFCQGGGTTTDSHNVSHPAALTEADYHDWRMVQVQQPSGSTKQTRFFDIVGNRASKTLTLYQPRVGYFTTPSFFSQYPTNLSNQARATINQTMIIGLGQAFDGTDPITVKNAPGLDSAHAGDPACFQCHWSLDPMKRFFRSNYTLNYSTQLDPAQTGIQGSFMFADVVDPGTTMYDLGKQIGAHPQFKTAWAQKLCAWANSGPCLATDPELQRVAQVFASHDYDWNALVHELFTSPLVTYAATTATTETNGAPVAIARRTQFCSTINNRLGLQDVCGLLALQAGSCATDCPPKGYTVPTIAAQLPSDGYSRGQTSALYVNDPDPFFRSSIEQICALVADQVVDVTGGSSLYSSATPTAAIADMAHTLMGLDASRDAEPISILTSHYDAAKAAGQTPTIALKSTFTVACLSPWVVSVGQ
jgi:hypothetical protein